MVSSQKRKNSRRKRCKVKHFRKLALINDAKHEKRRLEEVKRLKAEKRRFIRANCMWSYEEEFDTEVGDICYG